MKITREKYIYKKAKTKKWRAISEDLAFWRSNEGSLRDDD